jgi:hypothetical protein
MNKRAGVVLLCILVAGGGGLALWYGLSGSPQGPVASHDNHEQPEPEPVVPEPAAADERTPDLRASLEALPDLPLTSDFDVLLESLKEAAAKRAHDVMRRIAMEMRAHATDRADQIVAEIMRADAAPPDELTQLTKSNLVAYLALALPDDGFEPLVRELRTRWTFELPQAESRVEAAREYERRNPVIRPYHNALLPEDKPLAAAVGFCLADAALRQESERLEHLLSLTVQVFFDGSRFTETELPDVWLSEVVVRLGIQRDNMPQSTKDAVLERLRGVAAQHMFSERLRHQVRMIIMDPPATFVDLLGELAEAGSRNEAGAILSKYLDHASLTPEELMLVLGAIRAWNVHESALVLDSALRGSQRMRNEAAMLSLLDSALQAMQNDTYAAIEYWQLSGLLHAISNTRRGVRTRRHGESSQLPHLYSGPDTAGALLALRQLMAICADNDGELSIVHRRIMAHEVAIQIVELDIASSEQVLLMREHLTGIGGTTDEIASSVLRTIYYSRERSVRGGDFTTYWIGMLRVLLELRPPSHPFQGEGPNMSTAEVVIHTHLLHEAYPLGVLTDAESERLRVVMNEASGWVASNPPNRVTGERFPNAVEYLNESSLLTRR